MGFGQVDAATQAEQQASHRRAFAALLRALASRRDELAGLSGRRLSLADRAQQGELRRQVMLMESAVARWQVPPGEHIVERWVPLILAPEWAEAHPDEPPPQPGPELLRELLGHLSGRGKADAPA